MNINLKQNYFRVLYHLMIADFWERARRYSFLITIGITIFAAYVYLPPKEANYLTLGLGNYRGIYNSAWIGSAMAILTSVLLSLPAFYLVKNAIGRDEQTRVGQIIATTPISKPVYALGKVLSNFTFLAVMAVVIALSSIVMQLIWAEATTIDLWAIFSPMIFIVLPAMAVISALALLFETISWLRGTLGNVIYFFLWLGLLISTAANIPTASSLALKPANDLWGVLVIVSQMMKDTIARFPSYTGGQFSIGASTLQAPLQTFAWGGIQWTTDIILMRLVWIAVAIGISLVAAVVFRRFDPAYRRHKSSDGQALISVMDVNVSEPNDAALHSHLTPLVKKNIGFRPLSILMAELRLSLKRVPWWWYIVALGLIVAGFVLPTNTALAWLLPAAWLWPLPLWSSLGSREIHYATSQLVFSGPHPVRNQLPFTWLTGFLIAVVTGSGVLIKLVSTGDNIHILAFFVSALFIPSLALALGIWSNSNKLFEVVYMLWWYAGPVNKMDALNFMGTGQNVQITTIFTYGIGALLLIFLSILGRKKQVRM